jgi:geranylgeranyl reductase family protein
LERLGALEAVERSNPFRIDKVMVSAPNGTNISARPPSVKGLRDYGFVMPRKEFDYIFFQFAKRISNVTLVENIKIKELIYDGLNVCGVKSNDETFMGKIIIGADGVHSTIAKKLSLRNDNPKHRGIAMRAYFDNVENLNHEIEIHYEESILPGYAWIFPTGEHTANVGVGILTRFADARAIRDLFYRFLERTSLARIKLKNAHMIENSLKGCPLPIGSYPSERSYRNVLLVGDAASFVDSLTGEGIYYALRSGEFAAEAIDATISQSNHMEKVGAIYEKLWKKEFKWKEFYTGYVLQSILNNKYLANFGIHRASKSTRKAETLAGVIAHKLPKRKLFYNI